MYYYVCLEEFVYRSLSINVVMFTLVHLLNDRYQQR